MIPSEAVTGTFKVPFSMGVSHYDEAPPDPLTDVGELVASDRCRFCNQLTASIDVVDGRIVGYQQMSGGAVGSTTRPERTK